MNEDLNKGREGNTIFMDWKIQEYSQHLDIIIQLNVFNAENE